jgi:hypothetical protein
LVFGQHLLDVFALGTLRKAQGDDRHLSGGYEANVCP